MRLIVWATVPLIFFTVSIGKQPRYILPILPPLALLLARTLERRLAAGNGWRDPLLRATTASIGLLLLVLGGLLIRALPLIVMIAPALVVLSAGAIIIAGLVLIGLAIGAPLRRIGVGVGLAGAVMLVGLQYGLSPAGRDPVQAMASLVAQQRRQGEPIATYRVFVRNLVFYTGVRQKDLSDPAEVRVVPSIVAPGTDGDRGRRARTYHARRARARPRPGGGALFQCVRREAADPPRAGPRQGSGPGVAGHKQVGGRR